MSHETPDAWIERQDEGDPTAPWCSTCERHGDDCICNPDGDETSQAMKETHDGQASERAGQPAHSYKASAERTDEAERLLTPAIRRGAVNTEPDKRNTFVAQLIEAKSEPTPALTGPKYPDIQVELTGGSGNAFAILGAVRKALRRAGVPAPEIEAFTKEATAGDYDHLLQTAMAWVDAS